MYYIATFYTHLGAMTFQKTLKRLGDDTATMMPVPRALSSSCGTCVRYLAEEPLLDAMDVDVEAVYEVIGQETYPLLMEKE